MAVAPRHGKQTRVLMDQRDLSSFLRSVNISASMEPAEVTVFGDDDHAYIGGLRNGTFSFDGLFATTHTAGTTASTDDIVAYLDGVFDATAKTVLTVDLTRTVGGRAMLMKSDHTAYDISAPVSDVVSLSVDSQASQGYNGGVMLQTLTTQTATGSQTPTTTPGTTGSPSTGTQGGGVAHLHVTSFGTTVNDAIFKVQHSTAGDGSTWADLITFSSATAATFQRSTIAPGTNIKEAVRATLNDFTASSSSTAGNVVAAIGFSRRVRT